MAEVVKNMASAIYSLGEEDSQQTVVSNNLNINFSTSSGVGVSKTAFPNEFSAGTIITYTIQITNNGNQFFTGVRIIDDLGGGNLAYVVGSAKLTTSSQTYSVTPIATSPLTFALQELEVNQTITLTYMAQVIFNIPSSISSITNNVKAIGYSASGTANGFANSTIVRQSGSSLSLTKSSSKTDVVSFESFTYFLTLTNNTNSTANISSISDNLPSNFTLTAVRLQIGTGSQTILSPSQYQLLANNELVIPSLGGPNITVPANGSTILFIDGYLS